MVTTIKTYRLRGGQATPIQSKDVPGEISGFVAQTFGADLVRIDISEAKTTLLSSTDFQGFTGYGDPLDPENDNYAKASYQARPLKNTDGELVFSASEERVGSGVGPHAEV